MTISRSYVLVVNNGEVWLTRKVEELLEDVSHEEGQFELLIIDDGSTDETSHVAARLASTYPQITIVRRESRMGTDAALQLAMQQAKGERVVMMSSDDPENYPFRRVEVLGPWSNPVVSAPHFRIGRHVTQNLFKS